MDVSLPSEQHLHDRHGFRWDTSIGVDLFENLVDVDGVGLLSSAFLLLFTFGSRCTFAGLGHSFLGSFRGCLSFGWHVERVFDLTKIDECMKRNVDDDLFLYRPVQRQDSSTNRNARFFASHWSRAAWMSLVYIKKKTAEEQVHQELQFIQTHSTLNWNHHVWPW